MARNLRSFVLIAIWALFVTVSVRAQDAPDADEPETEAQPAPSPQPRVPPQTQPAPTPGPPERRMLPPRAPRGEMISLNFNRADLIEVIHILAQHLRINYTIDPEVKGSVTIYSAEPIRQDDLFPIFHQILRINGAVAVKTGDLYRISAIKDGKGIARPVVQGKEDGFALQVVPVRFFTVAEMKKLLTPFVTPGGEILDFPRGNFLIIVDLPSNIQRLMEIKDLMDINAFAGTRMELYQPKIASAEDLATEMNKVMQAYASSATQAEGFAAQFIPISRINQLLVISHSEAAWTYVQRWLERIDTLGEGPGRKIFIYPVENGKATELADVLSQALGLATTARRDTPRTLQDLHRGTTLSSPGTAGGIGTGRTQTPSLYGPGSSTSQTSGSAFAAAPAPSPAPVPVSPPVTAPPAAPRPAPPTAAKAEEQLRIVPDPATNSLIIYSTGQEFQNIRNILKDLDQIPRQVLLDALVVEVTLTDDQSLGIEYEILSKINPTIFGQTFGSGGAIRSGILAAAPASGLSQFGSGISGIIGSNDLKVFITALLSDSRVRVLSSPSVLAADNRPARIQVGTEEPIPTGTVVSSEAISTSTTIQYRNTGRILTIIPQVNSLGLVHLQIKVEVSQRGGNVVVGRDSFPSFDTRDTETTAVVQDGETLVLGGIINDRKSRSRTGIPYLMDIPVFGRFFGATSDEIDRTELIVLVTPHVIRSVQQGRDVTLEFKQRLPIIARELERMKAEAEKAKPAPLPPLPEPEPAVPEKSKTPSADKTSSSDSRSMGINFTGQSAGDYETVSLIKATAAAETDRRVAATDEPKIVPQGPWSVQVAAYPVDELARDLVKRLADQGYDAYVALTKFKGSTWYRVRVGHLPTEQGAKELLKTLRAKEEFSEAFVAKQ